MTRVFVLVLVCSTLTLCASRSVADEGIPLNEKYVSRIDGTTNAARAKGKIAGLDFLSYVTATVPVTLKAGQSIQIKARVYGDDRQVSISLLDPAGKLTTGTGLMKSTTTLDIKEVPDDGKFTIEVVSSHVGRFELLVISDQEKALENEIKALEQALEARKRELEALRQKKDK